MRWTLNKLFTRPAPPLRCGRVMLVEPSRGHFEVWSLLRETSRHHLVPYEPAWSDDELTPAAYRRRLKRYRLDKRRGTGVAFFVVRASDAALLGGVTLTNIRRGVTQSASIGYWIGLPFVRRGYASEAVAAALSFAFNDIGLNRVEAACMPSNGASIAVLDRCGFSREGLARRYLKINTAFEDHLLFAKLKDDVPKQDVSSDSVRHRQARLCGTGDEPPGQAPPRCRGATAEGHAG